MLTRGVLGVRFTDFRRQPHQEARRLLAVRSRGEWARLLAETGVVIPPDGMIGLDVLARLEAAVQRRRMTAVGTR